MIFGNLLINYALEMVIGILYATTVAAVYMWKYNLVKPKDHFQMFDYCYSINLLVAIWAVLGNSLPPVI